jgi:hypothetical protein
VPFSKAYVNDVLFYQKRLKYKPSASLSSVASRAGPLALGLFCLFLLLWFQLRN